MKWDDNLLLEGDTPGLVERGQWQLAMYAIHLGTGHSIYCKQIKVSTIEAYVFAAASFLAQFTGIDFRKDQPSDSHMGSILAPVYRDLRKYEQVPNRREPYGLTMHSRARSLCLGMHEDGLLVDSSKGCVRGTDYPSGPNLQVLQMSGSPNSITCSLLISVLRPLSLMMYVYSLLTSDMCMGLLLHISPLHLSRNFGLNGGPRRMGSMVRKSSSLPTLHLLGSAVSVLSARAFAASHVSKH